MSEYYVTGGLRASVNWYIYGDRDEGEKNCVQRPEGKEKRATIIEKLIFEPLLTHGKDFDLREGSWA